jgi:hypothetical protein
MSLKYDPSSEPIHILSLFGLTNWVSPGCFQIQSSWMCTANPACQLENSRSTDHSPLSSRFRANSVHLRQSEPKSGPGCQAKDQKPCQGVPFSLSSECWARHAHGGDRKDRSPFGGDRGRPVSPRWRPGETGLPSPYPPGVTRVSGRAFR